jgi:hypothetical protein
MQLGATEVLESLWMTSFRDSRIQESVTGALAKETSQSMKNKKEQP